MAWIKPQYDSPQADEAGGVLVNSTNPREIKRAIVVINNWRSCHSYPLNKIRQGIGRNAKVIYPSSLIAQRLKRMRAIYEKLKRLDWLTLSKMQDIDGCRAVVGNVRNVEKVVDRYSNSWIKHKLLRRINYIQKPRKSGYRSYHLIYSYYHYCPAFCRTL